jgi:hypothetical protein
LEKLAAIKFPTRFCFCASLKHPSWLTIDKKSPPVSTRTQSLPTTTSLALKKGIASQVFTIVEGEKFSSEYPSHHRLIANCKMKPSSTLYY